MFQDLYDVNKTSMTTDEVMNTYTRRRHSPQGHHNIEGHRNGNVYQAQHGDVPGRREDGVDRPFPNKPVSHRRPLNPGKQDSLGLDDFEKINISKQPLPPQEYHSNGIGRTTGSRHTKKDSHRQTSGELQMARAIHAKELILQEKLWSVEEKIRQKFHAAAYDDLRSGEQRNNRGQVDRGNAQTKHRLFEQQRREPVGRRETMMQERGQEDLKQLRRMRDQRNEDKIRITYEEERARWKRRETEVAQLQRKCHKGAHQITVHEQEVSGEFNKSRGQNVKEHTRRKRGDEKDNDIWGVTGVKSQDGTAKTKEREWNTTSKGDKGCTRERKCKEMYISDDDRDMPQISQLITSHKASIENHRGAGRKLSGGPLLPPVSRPSHSSRPEQGDLRQEESTDTSPQLLPCTICNRKFASGRLQKHLQVCKKVKQSHRQVFNSYVNRTKGSAIEQFWKTHSKSPEVLEKKNHQHNHKANISNLQEGRLQSETSQPKWSK